MCFSATASFTAAAATGAVGIACIRHCREKTLLPLAAIPLLFAAQQAVEGFLWLSLPGGRFAPLLANLFVASALVLWPPYIPAAVALAEPDGRRRRPFQLLLAAGAAAAVYTGADMARHPYAASLAAGRLCYINGSPFPGWVLASYFAGTCLPPLLSSRKVLRLFGMLVMVGLGVSLASYYEGFLSTWCFFAAAASLTILFLVRAPDGVPQRIALTAEERTHAL
jgi:hypothetical protein